MKKDVFRAARVKFVLYCGLITSALLVAIFIITYIVGSTYVEVQINERLMHALSGRKQTSNAFDGCILIAVSDAQITVEDSAHYDEDLIRTIVSGFNAKQGKVRTDGMVFAYLEGETQFPFGARIYAVYECSMEMRWQTRFLMVLLFGFAVGLVCLILISWAYSYYVIKPTKEALDKQRELVANASHELKTPLTIVKANMSLLRSEPASTVAENEKWISAMDTQITRMNDLILEMLNLSKIERDDMFALRMETDLSEVVDGCALCCEAGCFEKGLTLFTEIEPGVSVKTNRDGVEKVALILLDNALKYTEEGSVTVTLKKKRKGAVLSVANTGNPLSEEDCKRIFERFYKTGRSRYDENQPVSFGLGLPIAREIARQLGGDLVCQNKDGKNVFIATFSES